MKQKLGSKTMQGEGVFKRILVPVDGSVPSVIAQELVALLAKKFESRVTVIHVVAHELMKPHIQQYIPKEPEYVPVGAAVGSPPTAVHASKTPAASSPKEVSGEISDWYHQKRETSSCRNTCLLQRTTRSCIPENNRKCRSSRDNHTGGTKRKLRSDCLGIQWT